MAAYATAEQLRTFYLVQLNTGTEDQLAATDATLDVFLENATDIVNDALGFAFAGYGDDAVRRVRSYGGEYLVIPPHEPDSISQVQAGGSIVTQWGETSDGYLERVGDDLSIALCGWSPGMYAITARWGYGPPPAAIVEVVCELAVNIWRSRDKGSFTQVINAQGSGYLKVVGALTGAQLEVIERVRQKYAEQAV